MMPGEKAKNFSGTIKKLFGYIGTYRYGLIAVAFFAVGSTIFNIIGPKVLSKAITELFNGLMAKLYRTGGIDFNKIGRILLMLLGLYVISALLSLFQGWVMTGVSQKLCFRFRREISEKINRMPMKYFESRTVGEVLSRITNDVDTLGMSLNQSVTTLITSISTLLGVLIMMLSISPLMTLIALVILPVSGALIGILVKFSQKYFVAQQSYLGKINGQVEEVYSGQNIVKAFNREEEVLREFGETNDILYQSAWKSQFLSGMMQPIMNFIGNLGYVAVAVSGSLLTIKGTIEIGDIQAFIQYVKNFTQPITQLAQVSNMLQEPGQTVAIVGPTGAGKTTMVKLLMRFYDVNSGSIRVDGHDIRNFNRSELRESFGMVLQDTWLFKGTIMENIRYGRLDATDEEVIEAAKAAHAHRFIQTLPGGYQMELNEDASNVSQGQKQLLTIARAILADNRILILDEATSSVDTRTEQRIQKAMNNLMRGRTSFVIAHRLSTIKDADLILVMKDGDIIEQGSHEQLLSQKGFYAELYNSQFEDVTA